MNTKRERPSSKGEIKLAKRTWRSRMLKRYPNFHVKKWAQTSYRMKHVQPV